ncbi:glutathione S-transferase family protein [Kordiimonas aquimaris]|uniref:glutathione S-transferase family protein n=1 Tax=Kordiimonas aquimaris TaxID=707591 RepID=UPI0021CF0EA1|nr:glutathione S-transferase [Kordiimonas aquimaris]
MKVYEYKGFPNPARVRLALAEKGLVDDVEFIHVDVPAGASRSPEFLAINPSGAVPVLVLNDGTVISESAAITEYLDHLSGEPTLTGLNPKERGIIHMMQRKVEDGLLEAVAAYFHHATPGLGPEMETYQNAEWGQKRREVAMKTIQWMNAVLEEQDYLAADRLTVADITAYAGFAFADFAEIAIPEECSHVIAWRNRISSRATTSILA